MRPDAPRSGGRDRRGFSLAEMIIATTMLALFGASAITFYLRSLRSVSNTAGRNDAQQTASFALDFVDHDLRIAGTGLAPNQPLLIGASPTTIAFNADLITHDTSASRSGTYYDPSVPDSTALVWQQSAAQNLVGSTTAYPTQTYYQDAPSNTVLGEAETVQFWLARDTTPGAPAGRYNLWRQVNANQKSLVASNINYVPATSLAPFRYYYQNARNQLIEMTGSSELPVYHSSTNLALQARLDSIREVRVDFTGWFHDPQTGQDVMRKVDEIIRMPNTYMSRINQCPGPPAAVSAVTPVPSTGGTDTVYLSWPPSLDDGSSSGKKTVRVYLLYRKKTVDTTFVPLNSVTAQSPVPSLYSYIDKNSGLVLGTPYDYQVVARDCSPALSAATKATRVIPN